MERPIYVVSGTSSQQKDDRDYFSEGLVSLKYYLDESTALSPGFVTLSSDVFGPSWFPRPLKAADAVFLGRESRVHRAIEASRVSQLVSTLVDDDTKVFHPRWRLTEDAKRVLTNIDNLRQFPILNILNGYDLVVKNAIMTASQLGTGRTSSARIDASAAAELKISDRQVAIDRYRRCTYLLFLTLIEAVTGKFEIFNKLPNVFVTIPAFDYAGLLKMLKVEFKRFASSADTTHEKTSDGYIVPTVPTLVSLVADKQIDLNSIALIGSFYEAALGHEIMRTLSVLISAEYRYLLTVMQTHASPMLEMTEKLLSEEITPNNAVDDPVRQRIRLEKLRRSKRSERHVEMESKIPRGVDMIPVIKHGKQMTGAIDAYYNKIEALAAGSGAENAIQHLFFSGYNLQVLHSNFDVNSSVNPNYNLYTIWNWLFLSTGNMMGGVSSYKQVMRSVLVNLLVKDMHALLICSKCHEGFVHKTSSLLNMFQAVQQGGIETRNALEDALYTLRVFEPGNRPPSEITIDGIYRAILNSSDDPPLAEREKLLYGTDGKLRTLFASRAVAAAKAFTAIGFEALFSSMPSSIVITDSASEQVIRDINRSTLNPKLLFSFRNETRTFSNSLAGQDALSEADKSTLSFVGIWALRNAVRLNRNVSAPHTEFPSPPLPLRHLARPQNVSALLETAKDGTPWGFQARFERIVEIFLNENVSVYRLKSSASQKSTTGSFGQIRTGENDTTLPVYSTQFLVVQQNIVSSETLRSTSKTTLLRQSYFPLTSFDLDDSPT